MNRHITKIGKFTFYAGLLVSVYGLFKSFMARRRLPAGVCPIEDNRSVMYIGIALLIISVVLDFIDDYQKKRNNA